MSKISIPNYLYLLLLIPLLNGCVGYNTIAKSEPINADFQKSRPIDGWESIPVYDDDKLFRKNYKVVAKLTVTGNRQSLDQKMIEEMQKEASRFAADAIIFKNWKEVERLGVDGLAIGINLLTFFGSGYIDLNVGGKYVAAEYEGIAIQFY